MDAVGGKLSGNMSKTHSIIYAFVGFDHLELINGIKDGMKVLSLLAVVAQGDVAQR